MTTFTPCYILLVKEQVTLDLVAGSSKQCCAAGNMPYISMQLMLRSGCVSNLAVADKLGLSGVHQQHCTLPVLMPGV